MSHSTYNVGTEVKLEAIFRDPVTKALVEPEEVTCTVIDGEDETSQPEVSNNKGTYEAVIDIDEKGKGKWLYAFAGTGNFKARAESWFRVRPQSVPEP